MSHSRCFPGPRLAFLFVLIDCCIPAQAEDWPAWLGPYGDGSWRESGLLEQWPAHGPPTLWRVPVAAGYSGPSVADGRLYVTDRVQPLNEEGKPIKEGDLGIRGSERILCFNAENGSLIWKHEYDCPYKISYPAGPRTSPLVDGDRLYVLGAMGNLLCLNATDGAIVWSKNFRKAYQAEIPAWGWSAHPVLDGDKLICLAGGEGSAVVAINKFDGGEIWKSLTVKEIGYAPPVFYQTQGVRQMIAWLDTAIYGLNPETGAELWSVPFPANGMPQRPAVTIMTPRISGDLLMVSNFYNGSAVVRLKSSADGADVVWRADEEQDPEHKQGLNVLMATPMVIDGHAYGVAGKGELRCLDIETGRTVWETIQPTGDRPAFFATCFIVRQGDRCWILNDQGFLILARLSPQGYQELGRSQVLQPVGFARGRNIVWSHPAFAGGRMYARNDKELVCVDLRGGS